MDLIAKKNAPCQSQIRSNSSQRKFVKQVVCKSIELKHCTYDDKKKKTCKEKNQAISKKLI